MSMQIGKLYHCTTFCSILYPDADTARQALQIRTNYINAALVSDVEAPGSATYWSIRLNKPIGFCELHVPFLVLKEEDSELFEILISDKRGWIINRNQSHVASLD